MCQCNCTMEDLSSLKSQVLPYRIWSSINVKCKDHADGCSWTGSIADYRDHKISCKIIQALKAEIGQLKAKVVELKDDYTEIEMETEKLQTKYHATTVENRKVKSRNMQLDAKNKCLVVAYRKLKSENVKLSERNDVMNAKNKQLIADYRMLEDKSTKLCKEMNLEKDQNKLMAVQNKQLVAENNDLETKINLTTAENKKLRAEIMELNTIVTKVKSEMLNRYSPLLKDANFTKLKAENEELRNDISSLVAKTETQETSVSQAEQKHTKHFDKPSKRKAQLVRLINESLFLDE